MTQPKDQPRIHDAVLGGNSLSPALSASAVLGGIAGVKQRLAAGDKSALAEACRYGEEGEAVVRQYFSCPDHAQFFLETTEAGYTPRLSQKRFYWTGPAIDCHQRDLQAVIRTTTVDVVWEESGKKGLTVYPAAYPPESVDKVLRLFNDQGRAEELSSLEDAIALCLMMGGSLKVLAQNFIDRIAVWLSAK